MGLYDKMKTASRLEEEGVTLEVEDTFRITIARAGGGNRKFVKHLEEVFRKNRHLIQGDLMGNAQGVKIMHEAFAEFVVMAWQTFKDGEWVDGIETEDGSVITVTHTNIVKTFEALPDLFNEVKKFAEDRQNYLQAHLDGATKN